MNCLSSLMQEFACYDWQILAMICLLSCKHWWFNYTCLILFIIHQMFFLEYSASCFMWEFNSSLFGCLHIELSNESCIVFWKTWIVSYKYGRVASECLLLWKNIHYVIINNLLYSSYNMGVTYFTLTLVFWFHSFSVGENTYVCS